MTLLHRKRWRRTLRHADPRWTCGIGLSILIAVGVAGSANAIANMPEAFPPAQISGCDRVAEVGESSALTASCEPLGGSPTRRRKPSR